jgi:hypothetical protein
VKFKFQVRLVNRSFAGGRQLARHLTAGLKIVPSLRDTPKIPERNSRPWTLILGSGSLNPLERSGIRLWALALVPVFHQENRLELGFVSGHDFSRAVND